MSLGPLGEEKEQLQRTISNLNNDKAVLQKKLLELQKKIGELEFAAADTTTQGDRT